MYCSRKLAMILGSIVWGRKNFTFVYIKHNLSQTGASLVGRDLCANYLDVIIFTLCLLSSSRQFASLREAFMELSENMCTAVEMVPSVNSANFKLSSRESDNWICTQTDLFKPGFTCNHYTLICNELSVLCHLFVWAVQDQCHGVKLEVQFQSVL